MSTDPRDVIIIRRGLTRRMASAIAAACRRAWRAVFGGP